MKGAQDYLKIMPFVSTAKKLGHNAYEAIKNAISGTLDLIFLEVVVTVHTGLCIYCTDRKKVIQE
ncbi:hypothetical protein AALC75_23985 [Lachnospiraceae bacterium 48-42]